MPRCLGLNWGVLENGLTWWLGVGVLLKLIHPYLVLAGSRERLGLVPGDSSVAWLLVAWQPRTVRLLPWKLRAVSMRCLCWLLVQLLSGVQLFETSRAAAHQASCSSLFLRVGLTYVHWVDDTIQPSNPLLPPFPPTLNLSQHQYLFQWVGSLH